MTASLPDSVYEYVRHLPACSGGGADERCDCGAVSVLNTIECAYGYLWAYHGDDRRVHEARKLLLSIITRDGQRRGIQWTPEWARTRPEGST
jgi:hypothetical protein